MLLGEQAILTLIAIPVGFALGYGIAGLITVAIDTELIRFHFYQRQNLRWLSGGSRISFLSGTWCGGGCGIWIWSLLKTRGERQ